jgi:hypothetical protein
MADHASSLPGGPAFAVFRGELTPERVTWLFSRRSWRDRCLELGSFSLLGAGMAAFFWWLAGAQGFEVVLKWCLATFIGGFMLLFGLLHQSARWLGRRWLQWNELLTGAYEIELTDRDYCVRTERFALRLPYSRLYSTDMGLACVRLKLDLSACRALLLPIDDCQPPRTVSQVRGYVQERIRARKSHGAEHGVIRDRGPHLPFALSARQASIPIDGPARLADLHRVMEADAQKPKSARIRRRLEFFIYTMIAVLLLVVVAALATGHNLPRDIIIQSMAFGVLLLLFGLGAVLKRSKRTDVQSDPYAGGAELRGFVAPGGVSVRIEEGDIGVTWSGCDAVLIHEDRILARFWRGDFLLLSRHMFRSDSDWKQARQWAGSAESPPDATERGAEGESDSAARMT